MDLTKFRDLKLLQSSEMSEDAADDEIDIRQYWLIIKKHWLGIFSLAFMIALITALVVWSMTPIFQSTATLLIENKESKVVSIEDIYSTDTTRTEYLQTQFEIFKSKDLARKVIDDLKLANRRDFRVKSDEEKMDWTKWLPIELPKSKVVDSSGTKRDAVEQMFEKRLSIAPVRNTQLVKVSFESSDPELATQVANTLGEYFIESNLEAKLALTKQAANWMSSRLDALKQNLTESERRMQDFLERENLVDVEGVMTISAKEVGVTTEKLVDARNARAEAESVYRQVKLLGDDLSSNVESIPAIYEDPVIQEFKQKITELHGMYSEASKRYGPKHPKMIAVRSEIESVEASFQKQIRSLVEGVKNRYEVAVANERAMLESISQNKSEIQDISRKQMQLRELQREVESNRNLYEMFFNRLKETKEAGDLQTASARFIDRATIPSIPVKPRKFLSVALAFLSSLMIGVILAFLVEHLDNSLRGADDIESKLGVGFLGVVPLLKVAKKGQQDLKVSDIFLKDSRTSFAEAVRTIRTGVLLSNLDNPHKVIMVTSSVPGEGKSTVSLNLSFALAQMERVILIDADMRRPTIAKTLGISARHPGLSNLLAHTSTLEECVQRYEPGKLDVMTAGLIPPDPLEMLSSHRFADLIRDFESRYDAVIIDSAPVQAVSDALVISKLAKSLVYVVKAESTAVRTVKDGLARLRRAEAPICGVVLNQLDVEKASKYGDYYGKYYHEHGYSSADNS